jgi:hypothetical protein
MKDLIRMNQLAGTITESQARKMMEILDENSQSTLLDYIEEYIGADEAEFKDPEKSKYYSDGEGNIEFTIPFEGDNKKPSEDVKILKNIFNQNGIEIIRDTIDRDGGYKYTLLKVKYQDLLDYVNNQ